MSVSNCCYLEQKCKCEGITIAIPLKLISFLCVIKVL